MQDLFRDEEGITTVSMAISILISMALIFTGAQVYKVNSAASEIQEVADACVLAAESEVAEFVTAVNICDATLLSMTLLAGTLYGVGLVTACIPPTFALSEKLIELASQTIRMRERAYESMTAKLDAIQKLLPFLASANALGVAQANNEGAMQAHYIAVAALVPTTGAPMGSGLDDGLSDAGKAVEDSIGEIRTKAEEAEIAAQRAAEAKERAFMADCGRDPEYCMSQRARNLSGLSDADNPVYQSMDAWNFEVGLKRARLYYAKRLSSWSLSGSNVEQKADAILRKRFYSYASSELARAYVHDRGTFFDASLPPLYRNTDGLKETVLYTEAIYPITQAGDVRQMHAWTGCPGANGYSGLGSIAQLDGGGFSTCPQCEFVVSSLGKVAAASTSIANGFEYHYQEFRDAVYDYQFERSQADPLNEEVKSAVGVLFEELGSALSNAISQRLEARPPGRDGCVAMVVNLSHNSADSGFESMFVINGQTLGVRAAVAGAVVMADDTESGKSSITTLVEKLSFSSVVGGGAAQIAAKAWTAMLTAYEDGQNAVMGAIEQALNSFPLITSSGLGTWARDALSAFMGSLGLQPADIRSKKPVLVNTSKVVQNDSGSFAVSFKQAKARGLSTSNTTGLISKAASSMTNAIEGGLSSMKLDICTVELPFGTGSYVIEWTLPKAVIDVTVGSIGDVLSNIVHSIESYVGIRIWE